MSRFFEWLFCWYDADDYIEHLKHTFVPEMLLFQIVTWGYFMYVDKPQVVSLSDKIVNALFMGFGGVLLYLVYALIVLILGSILANKPFVIISIILGAIGTYMAFNVL